MTLISSVEKRSFGGPRVFAVAGADELHDTSSSRVAMIANFIRGSAVSI